MRSKTFTRRAGVVVFAVSTIFALGALTACSGPARTSSTNTEQTTAAAPMPASANYIAEMPEAGGQTTTMGITVAGDRVIAYANNGVDDEAYFFGTQVDGKMDLRSIYQDRLSASFDGTKLNGELVMKDAVHPFTAPSVSAPAGIYTAQVGNARASWVVRPDRTIVGVMDNSAPGDHKVTDQIDSQNQEFKDRVRQMRLDRQMQQAPPMTFGNWQTAIDGTPTTAVAVTGNMSF